VFADRVVGGILVTFANGSAAIYSSELLFRIISQAELAGEVQEQDVEDPGGVVH
jgi:hypothetical protein